MRTEGEPRNVVVRGNTIAIQAVEDVDTPWQVGGQPPDLAFATEYRPYATHGLHPFAAKFPPALARWAIECFTAPGDCVLDPFVGSGTTLVECRLLSRHGIGVEIDPLSRLLARVKSQPIDPAVLRKTKATLDRTWQNLSNQVAGGEMQPVIPDFPNRDHWFLPEVQRDLVLLRDALAQIEDNMVRDFFLVVYSSVIIAKGPSTVANALDVAHSRAHYVRRDGTPDVATRFTERYRRASRAMESFHERADHRVRTELMGEDARSLSRPSRSVDFILTSPPYVTAIEYPRSHKFSVWWIADLLGVDTCVYDKLRARYIGTENVSQAERETLARAPFEVPAIDEVTQALDTTDVVRAGRVRRYFHDMRRVLGEMLRVLKPEGYAVLVIADSMLRGVSVPTAQCLIALAESLNVDGATFMHCDTVQRTIREGSRQLPIKRGTNGDGMKTEHVLILQRSSSPTFFSTDERSSWPASCRLRC